jgi:hypothetical protein
LNYFPLLFENFWEKSEKSIQDLEIYTIVRKLYLGISISPEELDKLTFKSILKLLPSCKEIVMKESNIFLIRSNDTKGICHQQYKNKVSQENKNYFVSLTFINRFLVANLLIQIAFSNLIISEDS